MTEPTTDPRHFHVKHILRNGTEIKVRAIRRDDKQKLLAAFKELDQSSVYTRFFGYKRTLTETELEKATDLDFRNEVALVVTIGRGNDEVIIGGGRYVRTNDPERAELAFTVEEDYQGLGIAGLVLEHLIGLATASGISHFEADVLGRNQSMLRVFKRSGLPVVETVEGDTVHLSMALASPRADGSS